MTKNENKECKNYNWNYSSGRPHQKSHNGKKIWAEWLAGGEYYCDYCWQDEKRFWNLTDGHAQRLTEKPKPFMVEIRLEGSPQG